MIETFVLAMRSVTSRSIGEMMNIIANMLSIHKPLTSGKNALSIQAMACRTGQESNKNLKPDYLPMEVEEMEEGQGCGERGPGRRNNGNNHQAQHHNETNLAKIVEETKNQPKLIMSIQTSISYLLMMTMLKSSKSLKPHCYHTILQWKTSRPIL